MLSSLPSKFLISLLVATAAALSPWLLLPLINGAGTHDNQRIIEVLCAVTALLVALSLKLRRAWPVFPLVFRIIAPLALFFTFGLVSSITAYSPRHAWFEWANFLSLLMISWLIAREVSRGRDRVLDQLLLVCGLGSMLYIAGELLIYLVVLTHSLQPPPAAFIFGFDNYRFFNHAQTVTLPLLGLLTLRSPQGRKKLLWQSVTSLWWMLLFVSAGRGTLIGLFAGLCLTWFCLRNDAWSWCKTMLLAALSGLAAYMLLYVVIPLAVGLRPFGFLLSVVDRTIENPDSSRWQLWQRAWELVVAHPWLGVGPLHFAHFGRSVQNGAHPHNWLLQIACEWGTPALLCLVAAIALSMKKLLAVRRYLAVSDVKNRLTLAAWLTIGVAILVDGLVSGLIVMPTSQLWIALYIGCAWGWTTSMGGSEILIRRQPSTIVRVCGALGMLALIFFLVNGLWPEILNLPLYEEQNLQKNLYTNPAFRPRIWLGGYF